MLNSQESTGSEGPSLLSNYVEHLVAMTASDNPTEPPTHQEEDRTMTIPERLVSDLLIFR